MPFRDRPVGRPNKPDQRVRSNTNYRNTSFGSPTKAIALIDPAAAPPIITRQGRSLPSPNGPHAKEMPARPMPTDEVVRIIACVCRGLGHAKGIVLRDIRPSNIMMPADDAV